MVKLFYDQEGREIPSIYERIDSISQNSLTPTARLQSTRFSGPSINLAQFRNNPIQNAQTALQGAVNQIAGVTQSASVISQLGQQILNRAVGNAVSAVVGKGIDVVAKAGKEFIADLTKIKVDPNVFDAEDLALGQAMTQNLASSVTEISPDMWSDLGDLDIEIDFPSIESLVPVDYSGLDYL
jgi:hypothetical protein